MDARREEDDDINDFARAPLGEGEDERVSPRPPIPSSLTDFSLTSLPLRPAQLYNSRLSALLDRDRDDMRVLDEIRSDEQRAPLSTKEDGGEGTKKKKKKLTIEEVSRWTMV
jgi:hypothetical protein